jgi:hypothetical protein
MNIVDAGVLGCNTMWSCGLMPTFWRNILSPSSGLKWGCWEVDSLCGFRRRTGLAGIGPSESRNEEEMVWANLKSHKLIVLIKIEHLI